MHLHLKKSSSSSSTITSSPTSHLCIFDLGAHLIFLILVGLYSLFHEAFDSDSVSLAFAHASFGQSCSTVYFSLKQQYPHFRLFVASVLHSLQRAAWQFFVGFRLRCLEQALPLFGISSQRLAVPPPVLNTITQVAANEPQCVWHDRDWERLHSPPLLVVHVSLPIHCRYHTSLIRFVSFLSLAHSTPSLSLSLSTLSLSSPEPCPFFTILLPECILPPVFLLLFAFRHLCLSYLLVLHQACSSCRFYRSFSLLPQPTFHAPPPFALRFPPSSLHLLRFNSLFSPSLILPFLLFSCSLSFLLFQWCFEDDTEWGGDDADDTANTPPTTYTHLAYPELPLIVSGETPAPRAARTEIFDVDMCQH
ncbi:hypothetical protein C8J57DRAFT_1733996 [Mycena rebaudengoi]|nr:hypothetical protein C8J57DRAFT_1733996 [Mycena rebaudengoi]